MTQEEKQILLRDICARAPYVLKVKCEKYSFPVTVLYAGNINEVKFEETGGVECIYAIKPYLRPMSSMTKEEVKEFHHMASMERDYLGDGNFYTHYRMVDWLLAHHFDYRGLIEKGHALEAPGDMYKTE